MPPKSTDSKPKSSVDADDFFDGSRRSRLRQKLLKWFDENRRSLPWRSRPSRYRIWISEIMLQQTQVATVIDYYKRFLKRFPNVRSLAEADEQDVLKLWEGLGYYRRARQLHSAAKSIVADHRGVFPESFDEVLALPGIGRYTAGAILSIADDQPLPILEGNTQRLFSRLLALSEDIADKNSQQRLWAFSESLLPRKRCGDFNQALMELGALVCRPQSPHCNKCPLKNHCLGYQQGFQDSLPIKASKTRWEKVTEAVVLIQNKNRVLLRLGLPGERWVGMWDFPRFRIQNTKRIQVELKTHLENELGFACELHKHKFSLEHTVTRFRIQLQCFQAESSSSKTLKLDSDRYRWHPINALPDLALNVTARKIAQQCFPAS